MPYLNLENKLIIYSDQNVQNPKVRLADITDSTLQVLLSEVKSQEFVLSAGETKEVVNNLRFAGAGLGTSEFSFYRTVSGSDIVRMEWTGTGGSPEFRALKSTGVDATTQISVTRKGPRTVRFQSVGGTSLDTSLVLTGDVLYIEKSDDNLSSPFNSSNTGSHYTIQAKGLDYVDVTDEGELLDESSVALGTDFAKIFKVFANPNPNYPKIGDSVRIASPNFNFYNRGVFEITNLTDSYLEFIAPYAVEETASNSVDGVQIFDLMINFFYAVSSSPLKIKIDSDSSGFDMGKLSSDKCLFMSSLEAVKISLENQGSESVAVRCQHATKVD